MKSLALTLLTAVWLAAGALSHGAAPPLVPPPDPAGKCPGQTGNAPSASDLEGIPLEATITRIDHKQGRLELKTELGVLHTVAAPKELRGLRAGDTIVACVSGEVEEPRDGQAGPERLSFLFEGSGVRLRAGAGARHSEA